MISLSYAAALLVTMGCMAMLDARFGVVLWRDRGRDRRHAAVVLACGIVFFLLWDVLAIALGFYHRGDSPAMTGVMLAPELPVEELVFITFLCYITLVLHGLVALGLGRAGRR